MLQALIFCGGWDGHEPEKVTRRFSAMLEKHGFNVTVSHSLDILGDREALCGYDLIVPCWTMGEIDENYVENVSFAVSRGTGLAGCHGGMCDAFRESTEWQFMTGAQWVSHPGCDGVKYTVNIRHSSSPITEGIGDFTVESEQYYLHYDPAVEILATTRFPVAAHHHTTNKPVDMPVAFTKFWGLGRVFYCSLGHHDDVFDKYPEAATIMERGMLWSARTAGK